MLGDASMSRARERFSFAERLLKSAELSCEVSTERKNIDVKLNRLASDFEGLEHPGAARKEGRGQGYLVPLCMSSHKRQDLFEESMLRLESQDGCIHIRLVAAGLLELDAKNSLSHSFAD